MVIGPLRTKESWLEATLGIEPLLFFLIAILRNVFTILGTPEERHQ